MIDNKRKCYIICLLALFIGLMGIVMPEIETGEAIYINATTINLTGFSSYTGCTVANISDINHENCSAVETTSPWYITVNFTNVTNFSYVELKNRYYSVAGASTHVNDVEIFCHTENAYVDLETFTNEKEWWYYSRNIADSMHFIDSVGNVSIRLNHTENGNANHRELVDTLRLIQKPTFEDNDVDMTQNFNTTNNINNTYINQTNTTGSAFNLTRGLPVVYSNISRYLNTSTVTTPLYAPTKVKEFTLNQSYNGSINIFFDLSCIDDISCTVPTTPVYAYGQVYKNNLPYGAQYNTQSFNYVNYTETFTNIYLNNTDLIQLYIWIDDADFTDIFSARNGNFSIEFNYTGNMIYTYDGGNFSYTLLNATNSLVEYKGSELANKSDFYNINGSNITSGTIPQARLDGYYVNKSGDTMTDSLTIDKPVTNNILSVYSRNGTAILYIYTQKQGTFSDGINVFRKGNASDINGTMVNNEELGYHSFYGWNGAAYVRGAYALVKATETWSTTARGAKYQITTIKKGTTTEQSSTFEDGNLTIAVQAGTGTRAACFDSNGKLTASTNATFNYLTC